MRILTCVLLSLGLGLACSEKPTRSTFPSGSANQTGQSGPGGTGDSSGPQDGSTGLELVPDWGSKLRFMNGQALTVVYSRIFKEDAEGFAHCAKTKPIEHTGCRLMFSAEERASMGMFDLYSERMGRGTQNVAPAENLTLNYMRNLRAALARECTRLVEKESSAVSEANLLVRESPVSAPQLEAFMRKLIDAPNPEVELDIPLADYVQAFQIAEKMGDPQKAKKSAYINLCISLAMDPQIFMY